MEEASMLAELGRPAAALGLYGLAAAAVAGVMPRAAERMAHKARMGRAPGDPGRYAGLEVYRLWVNKGEQVEAHRVESALVGLELGGSDGVYLEMHVAEFTDVVVAGRGIDPAIRALRANHQGRVQFVRVEPDEDPFAPPLEEAVGRVAGGADGGAEDPVAPSAMVEVCRSYKIGGADGWGTKALAEFAQRGDPVDAGLSQIRDALEVDRGEAAAIQLHLRPATNGARAELAAFEEAYKHHPKKPRLGSFAWLLIFKRMGEAGRDWARQRGFGQKAPEGRPQDTYESKRVRERRNVRSLYEVELVAYGRVAPERRRLLEAAFDKYVGAYEDRTGEAGGSRIQAGRGRGALAACVRMPRVRPPSKQGGAVMNPSEIAAMWHPLGADSDTPGRRESLVISLPPPATLPKTGVTIGTSNFAGLQRAVMLNHETLCRHGHVLGVPGVGKTAALYRLGEAILTTPGARGDAMGMLCLDPKSDLFTALLENVGRLGRAEDTIVLDPGDDRFRVPGLNILAKQAWMTERKQAQVLVGAFKTRFASVGWGPKMEEFLSMSMHALIAANRVRVEELGGEPRYTILDLSSARFLAPKTEAGKDDWEPAPMRAEVLRVLRSSKEAHRYADLMRFWEGFDANHSASTQKTDVNPVTNKINQLLTDAITPVFGAPHCDIDFLSLMSEGKVLLANLSKDTFGQEGSKLFGSLLLNLSLAASQYRHEKAKRGTFPGKMTEFVYLVDEVQDFACREMCDIINQGRAYRTPLWVAHQEMRQVPDKEIKAAFEAVGTSLCFRTDLEDSAKMSKVFGEPFTGPVLANFAAHNFVVRGENLRATCSTLRLPDEETAEQREVAQARATEARSISAELYATEWDPDAEERRRAERYGERRRAPKAPDPRGPEDAGEETGPNTFRVRRNRPDPEGAGPAPSTPEPPEETEGSEGPEPVAEDFDFEGLEESLGDLDGILGDDERGEDDDESGEG